VETKRFETLVAEALDALPARFRARLENIAVVVEDRPSRELERRTGGELRDSLLLGVFEGIPQTKKSFFQLEAGPARIVLFQKNIEAYARTAAREQGRPVEDVIREEVRLTVLHELGHYFGMSEEQLEDV
jgi:predicted Zn-dependent protease with MMP-like domain